MSATPPLMWPDAELLVIDYLRAGLALVDTVDYPAADGIAIGVKVPEGRPVPFVRVNRVGGVRAGVFDQPRILLESWAAHSHSAAANLDLIRDLMWQLTGERSGYSVSNVVEVGGPANIADPDTGSPRYLMTFGFTVRANPRP